MRKSIGISFVVLLVVVGAVAGYLESRKSPEELLAAVAAEANKKCPMKVDEDTRIDKVASAPGMRLEYTYTTVSMAKEDLNIEELNKNLREILTKELKTGDKLGKLREMKVTFVYIYNDKNGKPLTTVEIGPADYGAN